MKTECIEWQKSKDRDGYGWQWHDGRLHRAHRIAFAIEHRLSMSDIAGLKIRHSCDNPSCVNPAHLLAGSNQDNVDDKVKRNRQAKGEGHGISKLDREKVLEIRKLRADGQTLAAIASRFGIHLSSVHLIVTGKLWRHVGA